VLYLKDANVRLRVPARVGGASFEAWDLVGSQINQVGVKQMEVNFKLNGNVLAQCHWSRAKVVDPAAVVAHLVDKEMAQRAKDAIAQRGKQPRNDIEAMAPAFSAVSAETADSSEPPPQARDLLMRVEAAPDAAVLGVAPAMTDTELVEEGQDGWQLVNYRGVVGWVNAN
jgi:hypothetical protein